VEMNSSQLMLDSQTWTENWHSSASSVVWFISLLVREEVLLADLCERKILFRLKIYYRLRQATAKRTSCMSTTTGCPYQFMSIY